MYPYTLLDVVPGETSCAHKKIGTRMYTATWLVTAKAWILPKYPLTVDSINYGYSHTIKYYIGAKMGTFLKVGWRTICKNSIYIKLF